jgi:hypothetical protein
MAKLGPLDPWAAEPPEPTTAKGLTPTEYEMLTNALFNPATPEAEGCKLFVEFLRSYRKRYHEITVDKMKGGE